MAEKFNFEEVKQKLDAAKRELNVLLSNQAQNYFLQSFTDQAFDSKPWKEVQRRIDGTNAYKYPSKPKASSRTSPILVRRGTLRRAVSTMARTATRMPNGFKMVLDVPYAKYLNDGTDKMVARPFIGQTTTLTAMQQKTIIDVLDKIFKQ